MNSIRDSQSEIRNSQPIGIFDSGVGGLTVYRALHEHLPNERFVYLGDTARVPYGTKSLATVERYAVENARFLAAHGIKLLVVACNTASALALPAIRAALKVDVVGVIGPGARGAVATSDKMQAGSLRSQRSIGVIATESTVQSGAYTKAINKADANATVIERACPLFVPLAEEGWADNDVARVYDFLAAHEQAGRGTPEPRYFLAGPTPGEQVELPHETYRVFRQVIEAMRQGLAVTVVPQSQTLTTQQAALILIAKRRGSVSPSRVSARLGTDGAGMSRLVDRLEAKGLVVRETSPTDRRAVVLTLTPAGHALSPELAQAFRRAHHKLFKGLAEAEMDRFRELLTRLRANLGQAAGSTEVAG